MNVNEIRSHGPFVPEVQPILPTMGFAHQLGKIIKHLTQNQLFHADALKSRIHHVSDISCEIRNLEKDLGRSTIQMEKLRGEEGTRIRFLFIETLTKSFYQRYNQKPLADEQFKYAEILKKCDTLRELRSQLLKTIDKIIQQVNHLVIPDSLSSEEIPLIFEFETKIREFFALSNLENDKYRDLYNQKIAPLLNLAKQSIVQSPFQFSVQAAAAKGKAAQAGLQAIESLQGEFPIKRNASSEQKIFLLSKYGVVFKQSSPRDKEEERIVNDLFDLMSKRAIVGTFKIKKASPANFGIQNLQKNQGRGFAADSLSLDLKKSIRNTLSDHDLLILDEHQRRVPMSNPDLENYQKFEKKKWLVKLSGGENAKRMTFKELQGLYLSEKLPMDAEIGLSSRSLVSFSEHISDKEFFKALNYLPTLQTRQTLYLIPDLSIQRDREAYERCEQFKWSYKDASNMWHEVDFKTLHTLFLLSEQMQQIIYLTSSSSMRSLLADDLGTACNVKWKTISPDLMEFKVGGTPLRGSLAKSPDRVSPLMDFEAKPFIEDMILIGDLANVESILQRLTPESEYNAILTGELQLLDLHAHNLGVVLKPNAEYEKFKETKFYTPQQSDSLDFKTLIMKYLNGNISPRTVIEFYKNEQHFKKPLQELTELQRALDVRWELVIFDTGLSLSEDNRLQFQYRNNVIEYLIPLRSVLLQTDWKDQPLTPATVKQLINSDDRDFRVKSWIKREDAPIYKMISKKAKRDIEQYLEPLLKSYTLSERRKSDRDRVFTIKILQNEFANDISKISDSRHLDFWSKIEKELSFTIRPGDTLEKIASRYNRNIENLEKLNPTLDFTPGQKIKMYDLISDSFGVLARKKIARQLFPRLTIRQQNALLERQDRRKKYLTSYLEFSQSSLQGSELIDQIERFLNKPETPLSSMRKEELLGQLKSRKTSPLALDIPFKMKQMICQECQPTYFNLMKAMYPFLADAYAINEAVYGKMKAGLHIGLFTNPLQEAIYLAKSKFPFKPIGRLAETFEKQLTSIQEPAFFHHLK